MLTKPLLIATIATGLSVAAFSPQVSADPIGGAIVGGAIGAAVGGPPGAAVGAILGTAIGTDVYYNGPRYAYGPAPYYDERYSAPPPDYAPPPAYAPRPLAPAYAPAATPAYYAPRVAPVYYAPGLCTRGLRMFTARAITMTTVPATTPGAMLAPTTAGIAKLALTE